MSKAKKRVLKFEAVTAIIIVAVVLIAGWQTYNQRKEAERFSTVPELSQPASKAPEGLENRYRNEQIGLEFYYPNTWQVREANKNSSTGLNVTVSSPGGLQVNVNAHYIGYKPTTCQQNIYDKPHITSNCPTIEIFNKQFVPLKTPEGDTYLIQAKYTPGNTSSSQYLVFLSSDPTLTLSQEPLVGTWPNYGIVNTGVIYFNTSLSGVDNSDPSYYLNSSVIQAEEILKTFRTI